jgi:hypothetical protein
MRAFPSLASCSILKKSGLCLTEPHHKLPVASRVPLPASHRSTRRRQQLAHSVIPPSFRLPFSKNSPPQTENPLPCTPAPDQAGERRGSAPHPTIYSPPPGSRARACDAAAAAVMGGFFRTGNLASRLFDRQCFSPRPGATVRPLLSLLFSSHCGCPFGIPSCDSLAFLLLSACLNGPVLLVL